MCGWVSPFEGSGMSGCACGCLPSPTYVRSVKNLFYFWLVYAFVFETEHGANPIVQATSLFKFKVAKKRHRCCVVFWCGLSVAFTRSAQRNLIALILILTLHAIKMASISRSRCVLTWTAISKVNPGDLLTYQLTCSTRKQNSKTLFSVMNGVQTSSLEKIRFSLLGPPRPAIFLPSRPWLFAATRLIQPIRFNTLEDERPTSIRSAKNKKKI